MDIQVGDILKMKKKHPCGSSEWEVLRIGADFRLKCTGCGHQITIPRVKAEKNVRGVMHNQQTESISRSSDLEMLPFIMLGLFYCFAPYPVNQR